MADFLKTGNAEGIGLSGQPSFALNLGAQQLARDEARRAAKEAARLKAIQDREAANQAGFNKVLDDAIKIPFDKFSTSLVPKAKAAVTRFIDESLKEYALNSNTAINKMRAMVPQLNEELQQYKLQSDVFFNEDKKDASKEHKDVGLLKADATGDYNNVINYAKEQDLWGGYNINDDGQGNVTFVRQSIPRYDLDKRINEIGADVRNYVQLPTSRKDKYGKIIPETTFTLAPDVIEKETQNILADPNKVASFVQQMREADPNSIPKGLKANSPEAALFITENIKKRFSDGVRYKYTDIGTPQNPVPEKSDGGNGDKGGFTPNGWTNGKVSWTTYPTTDGKSLVTTINTVGATENPITDFAQPDGKVISGKVVEIKEDKATKDRKIGIVVVSDEDRQKIDALGTEMRPLQAKVNPTQQDTERLNQLYLEQAALIKNATKSKAITYIPYKSGNDVAKITDNFGGGVVNYNNYISRFYDGDKKNTASPVKQIAAPNQNDWNAQWSKLKKGESMVGLDGITYKKK